jgi:ABC-2 type transport system permease protein
MWVLGLIELALGLLIGKLVFDIPMHGSVLLLFGVAAVYLVVAVGIGLWISAVVETQQQAMFVTFFVVNIYLLVALGIGLWISTTVETQQQAMFVTYSLLMIYLLMSGLFTPVRGMPGWAQWATEFNPVMHLTRLMRAVLQKGAGFADVARQLVILALSAVVVLSLAVRRYRKTSA